MVIPHEMEKTMKSQHLQFRLQNASALPVGRFHRDQDITQIGLLAHGECEHVRRFGHPPVATVVVPDSAVADEDGRELRFDSQPVSESSQELLKTLRLDRNLFLPIEYLDVGVALRQFAC